jgi:DNA processing protein
MTDKLAWLALRGIPRVGPVLFHRLLAAFGSPARVLSATLKELTSVRGVSPGLAQAIHDFREWDRLEAQLHRLEAQGCRTLTLEDADYPLRLREIPIPPPILFVKGEIIPKDSLAVALVGTRRASYYGLRTCRRLARELAQQGVTVISGLARGIDTMAHQGALEGGGRTLAVLGCGLDVVYPPENRELYREIPESGALISEYPLGTPPEPQNFPRRNRLISGLALGVVVVEAAEQSGAHITVQCALEQGREVLAVPGPIDSPTSRGPHRLIQEGAKLVREVGDILTELPKNAPAPKDSGPKTLQVNTQGTQLSLLLDDPLLPFLGTEPVQLEELMQVSRLPAPEVLSRLTLLELQGLIRELPGKCYILEA